MTNHDLRRAIDDLLERLRGSSRFNMIQLNPPASPSAMASLLAAMGPVRLGVVADVLALHDGESGNGGLLGLESSLFSATEIASAFRAALSDEAAETDEESFRCIGPVRGVWWSARWIPFGTVAKELLCVDYNPAPGGTSGQMTLVDQLNRHRRVLTSNLTALFDSIQK